MATNKPYGDGHRNGAIKKESQQDGSNNENWTKRDAETGKFLAQKSDGQKFKGVRKEKS